jgi:hypothetical protein
MTVSIKIPKRSNTAVPVLVVTPDGTETLEFYRHSCDLVFFEVGTKVYLYEPVELKLAVMTEATEKNTGAAGD